MRGTKTGILNRDVYGTGVGHSATRRVVLRWGYGTRNVGTCGTEAGYGGRSESHEEAVRCGMCSSETEMWYYDMYGTGVGYGTECVGLRQCMRLL
eukprot:2681019-Rhodomonas_salina.2